MTFWSQATTTPKQKNKFIVRIGKVQLYNVKSVTKPTFTIESKTYTLINHKFKYPGIPNWEPISITFVDPVVDRMGQSTEQTLYKMITDTGYANPTVTNNTIGGEKTTISTPSKASTAANSFYHAFTGNNATKFGGTIEISQLKPDGESLDTWTLHGPIIKSISFGDLDYSSDDLVEYKLEIDYDFATYDLGYPWSTSGISDIIR